MQMRKTAAVSIAGHSCASPSQNLLIPSAPMHDPRFDKLARLLVTHSTRLAAGERVLIDAFDIPDEMTVALIRAARAVEAVPFVQTHHARVGREMAREATRSEGRRVGE